MSVQILVGDALEKLKTMPDQSVHCCVTSPPYYGLRDYGVEGQMGLEKTPEEYVAKMVEVFREVRRVLRDDGTLWLNLGDSYANSGMGGNPDESRHRKQATNAGSLIAGRRGQAKQLLGIPWRVAFALQSDGWILRQDIIWHKPNPMPESVNDRCTKAHEYLFLLAKSQRYYFDSEAMKEPAMYAGKPRGGSTKRYEQNEAGMDNKFYETRNRRSVWSIIPCSYKGAHFAVFPPALIEPCIKAGCPVDGTVLDPFGGSGTTGQVAKSLGRNAILIELNPNYIPLIEERVA